MTKDELKLILEEHAKWVRGDGGKRADLRGADLRGANLRGANLGNDRKAVGLIARVTRIYEPYEFFAWRTDKGDIIKAGCRFMSVDEYRAHVAKEYPGTTKAAETLAILDFIEARFKAVGGPV